MAMPDCVMFKQITAHLINSISAAVVTSDDKKNKMALYALLNTTSPLGWHLKNFYTYRSTAFGNGDWRDALHSDKKKMGANAFKKHLGAMRMALELDISTFRELMLKYGKQVVDDLATVLVKHTFDFGSGIDAETKERLQTYGKTILKSIVVSDSTQEVFAITSTCFSGFAALKCKQLEGLQNVLIMITAYSFSAGVPLPQEPSGQLVLPAVLVYFGLSATLMRLGYVVLTRDEASGSTVEKIISWVVLFVGARGLVRFQALQQQEILGVLSAVYLLFPTEKMRRKTAPNSEGNFFVQIVECLLNRCVVLWLMNKLESFTGMSSIFPSVFFFSSC